MTLSYDGCTCGSGTATDVEYQVLCDIQADGTSTQFLRHYVRTSDAQSASLSVTDTELDGSTPYAPTGTVVRCADAPAPKVGSTAQRQTDVGQVTIAAGARSVSWFVLAGTATVAIGGTAAVTFPANTSGTWAVDEGGKSGEQLADNFVFTGVAGSDFIVLTTREQ